MGTLSLTSVKSGGGRRKGASVSNPKNVLCVIQEENCTPTIYLPWSVLARVLQHGTIILRDYSPVGYSRSVELVIKPNQKKKTR